MKVTAVDCFLVKSGFRKNLAFVKVTTDDGIIGWGEAFTHHDRERATAVMVDELARYLIGRDPFQIKYFTEIAFNDGAARRSSLEFHSALSGIEIALWDIVGKALDQPVYNLLGGPVRDKFYTYANGWSFGCKTPDEFARAAEKTREAGFTALKFYCVTGAPRTFISAQQEQEAVDVVRAVRDAVGPDVELMVDVSRKLSPYHAIRLAERLEEFNLYWFEEPCTADNIDALAEIKAKSPIPVVTGEGIHHVAGFRDVFVNDAADIINPDVASCGGILKLKEIAATAEPYYVAMSPHNYNSTLVGMAATIHACATMPNFIIAEYFVTFEDLACEISPGNQYVAKDSYIGLPTGPGLGIDVNEDVLKNNPFVQFDTRVTRQISDEGP
ncbi:MAG: mandelate racemase/muconate lactonizing enzyme family protein [Rhodospirillaceae bacterium]|jgi:galactonate dehydratase